MLSVKVLSPSAGALAARARRTTTMIGSRLSILPLGPWSKRISLDLNWVNLRRGGARIPFADVYPGLRGQSSYFGAAVVPVRGPVLGHLIKQLKDPRQLPHPRIE
jgi:hypothetical protein